MNLLDSFLLSIRFSFSRVVKATSLVTGKKRERDDYSLFVLSLFCQLKPNGQLAKKREEADVMWMWVGQNIYSYFFTLVVLVMRKVMEIGEKKWKTKSEWYAKLYYVDLFHLCWDTKTSQICWNCWERVDIQTHMWIKLYNNIPFQLRHFVLSPHDMTTT